MVIEWLNARLTIRVAEKRLPVNLNAIINASNKVDILRELRRLFTRRSREVDSVERFRAALLEISKHCFIIDVRFPISE